MTDKKEQPTTVTNPSTKSPSHDSGKKAKTTQQSNEERNANLNAENDGNEIFERQEEARRQHREQEEQMLRDSAEGGR
jgi:hypothetical protein